MNTLVLSLVKYTFLNAKFCKDKFLFLRVNEEACWLLEAALEHKFNLPHCSLTST